MKKTLILPLLCLAAILLPSCETVPPEVAARNARISMEPRGDYHVGRRYFIDTTRFWGYLRQPGQPWATAKLVIMRQGGQVKAPDHLPEEPAAGSLAHGFDHNREYRIRGRYTGRAIYDPNSNLTLPEFQPYSFELVDDNPGFLFTPRERYSPDAITIYPPSGLKEMR